MVPWYLAHDFLNNGPWLLSEELHLLDRANLYWFLDTELLRHLYNTLHSGGLQPWYQFVHIPQLGSAHLAHGVHNLYGCCFHSTLTGESVRNLNGALNDLHLHMRDLLWCLSNMRL